MARGLAVSVYVAVLGSCVGMRYSRKATQNGTATKGSCASYGCSTRWQSGQSCQCNSDCSDWGDCCSDIDEVCGNPASCAAIGCGKSYSGSLPCQCNDNCFRYDNCCSDFSSLCSPAPTPAPTPAPRGDAAAYWSGVDTSSKSALQDRLRSGTTTLGYRKLWDAYKTVWVNLPGKCQDTVFDVYSSKCWAPGTDQCGTCLKEGDCYNREHSWPKSWWGSGSTPAISDLFHVMPSDGYVNGRRAAYPFGEVNNPSYVSGDGHKVGYCSTPGYDERVFEPADSVKGLMARGHLYMATRYAGEFKCCQKDAVSRADLKPWTESLMLKWHAEHPPQAWEVEFNNRVEPLQGNRNPFIDFPEIAQKIFR